MVSNHNHIKCLKIVESHVTLLKYTIFEFFKFKIQIIAINTFSIINFHLAIYF